MVLLSSPLGNFGEKMPNFKLKNIDDTFYEDKSIILNPSNGETYKYIEIDASAESHSFRPDAFNAGKSSRFKNKKSKIFYTYKKKLILEHIIDKCLVFSKNIIIISSFPNNH